MEQAVTDSTTEMAQIPASWSCFPLTEAAPIDSSTLLPSNSPSKVFSYIGMEDVAKGQWCNFQARSLLGKDIKSNCVSFNETHVLYGKLRPYLNKVVVPQQKGVGSTEWVLLKPNPAILDRHYLAWYLRSPSFVAYAAKNSTGGRMPRIRPKALKSATIPVPHADNPMLSIDVQQRIVARIEVLLAEIKESRELLDRIRRDTEQLMDAAMAQVFSSQYIKTTEKLADICKVIMGQSPPGTSYTNQPVGPPLINGPKEFGEVHPIPVQWTSSPTKMCKECDLLICVRGATTGRINWADQPYCLGRGVAAVRPINRESTNMSYIAYFVKSQQAKILRAGRGSTFPNVSKSDIEKWPVPKVNVDMQERVVVWLDSVREGISDILRIIDNDSVMLDQLEQSILERAFRGEL